MPTDDCDVAAAAPGEGGLGLAWRLVSRSFLIATGAFALLALVGSHAHYPLFVSGGQSRHLELAAGVVAFAFLGTAWGLWRRHGYSELPAVVLALALLWLNVARQESPRTWDFECYFWTGRVIADGVNIYDWVGQAEVLHHARLPYPPFLPCLFSCSRLIGSDSLALEVSFLLWTALNYWATVVLACLLPTVLIRVYRWPARAAAIGTLLALAVNVPLQRTLYYSQVNILIVDCFLLFLLLLRTRPWLAALALSVATLTKTSPLLLAGLLPAARRYRDLVRFLAVLAALVAASMAVAGYQPWRDFLSVVPHARDDVVDIYRENSLFNLAQVACRLIGLHGRTPALVAGLTLVELAVLALVLLVWRRAWRFPWTREGGARLELENLFPLALLAVVLVSPKVWEHLWLWVLLPAVLTVYGVREDPRRLAWAVAGYALIFWVPTFDYLPLSFHRLAGCLCLLACLARPSPPQR